MKRTVRKHAHLMEKIAEKTTRSHKKPGERTKRWRKWSEAYKTLAE